MVVRTKSTKVVRNIPVLELWGGVRARGDRVPLIIFFRFFHALQLLYYTGTWRDYGYIPLYSVIFILLYNYTLFLQISLSNREVMCNNNNNNKWSYTWPQSTILLSQNAFFIYGITELVYFNFLASSTAAYSPAYSAQLVLIYCRIDG